MAGEVRGRVLVVDDEAQIRRMLTRVLEAQSLRVDVAGSIAQSDEILRQHGPDFDVVLADLNLGDGSGLDLLALTRTHAPEAVVVVMTAAATVSNAVQAMRAGAYDFLVKPFEPPGTLERATERALEKKRLLERNRALESRVAQADRKSEILGDSAPMRRLRALIDSVGPTDSTVLILGESGTGKELVARAVHASSERSKKPFLAINCGALAETVLESELFGHARGAFTGAVQSRRGLFEEAAGGTLFLDEIGEMPLLLQVRLLRVLEEREVRPVGSNETRTVDVRVVAATNRDLLAAVRNGDFREDLYYRLDVVSIPVPPLRDRASDIPLLVHTFLARHAQKLKRPVAAIEPDALQILCAHAWPGNVRELQNAIERSVVLARSGTITVDVLPPALTQPAVDETAVRRPYALPLSAAVEAFERSYLDHTLTMAKGNIAEAARSAGVDRSNYRRLLKKYGIEASEYGADGPRSGSN